MPGVTNPAGNTAQPKLERAAQRVGENNPGIKARFAAQAPDGMPERFLA